jgi:hypothetical protein
MTDNFSLPYPSSATPVEDLQKAIHERIDPMHAQSSLIAAPPRSPSERLLRSLSLLGLTLVTGGIGCADEAPPTSAPSVAAFFERAGVPASEIQFEGDNVRVQGDVIITGKQLAAVMSAPATAGGELAEKGYTYGTLLGQARPPVDLLSFHFDSNVPQRVRDAVYRAAAEWSTTSTCIRVYSDDFYYPAKITYEPDPTGHAGITNPHYLSEGSILFNSDWLEGTGSFASDGPATDASLYHTALHEMGHLIGLAHPSLYQYVPGTQTSSPTCGHNGGGCKGSYPTVMDEDVEEQELTPDDRATASVVQKPLGYKACHKFRCPVCR